MMTTPVAARPMSRSRRSLDQGPSAFRIEPNDLMPRKSRVVALCFWLPGLLVLVPGCARAPAPLHLAGASMGTNWQVTAWADQARKSELQMRLEARLQELNQQMSAWEPDSALSRFNRAPAATWVDFPPELFEVVAHALELAKLTDGAYDPTIAPLVDVWGFGSGTATRTSPPTAHEIQAAKARVGWQMLELDRARHRAFQTGTLKLDINSLGPGFAVDALAGVLRNAGVERFLVELGGEMRAGARKPDGSAWRIAIESPYTAAGADFDTVVELHHKALGTSGDYRAGFVHAGQRYSHTLDPRSGAPIQHDLAAVTVIADSAMAADARAAALLVLGPDEGMAFARTHNLAAIFTLRTASGLTRQATPAFEFYRTQ